MRCYDFTAKIIMLHYSRDVAIPVQSRICFIKYGDRDMVGVAQHLTNVVFIDRALLVMPYLPGEMPDEVKAINLLNITAVFPAGIFKETAWPAHVENQVCFESVSVKFVSLYMDL